MRGRVTVSTGLLVVLLAVLPASVGAEGPVVVNGGGTGTVDGATPFSQFGLGLSIQPDGAVRGHFECLVAGASAVPGLHLMSEGGG
ncbi:MAG TPA: hypothetical protein VG370_26205 [Chloroflexota bacterium]|jgi:hypothetical protein|nr:hypothetical protein [Chloroflexota bacterium]